MSHIVYSLNDNIEHLYSHNLYITPGQKRNPKNERIACLLKKVIREELTDRQKACVEMLYYEQKTIDEIAQELGIRPTTVYKHLRLARKTLRHCAEYFIRDP